MPTPTPDTDRPVVQPRRFYLQRTHDVTGVSGTGHVADGVLWPDGTASVRWAGDTPSTVSWASLDDAVRVHGHGGNTRFVWVDDEDAPRRCPYHPDAYGYEHETCGFHWHGRDPMDVPMIDGQPDCPRCRLVQLRTTLADVLSRFVHKGHPGEPCLQTGWISVRTVERWRQTLTGSASAADGSRP